MGKNKKKIVIWVTLLICIGSLYALFNHYYSIQTKIVKLSFDVKSEAEEQFQVYYDTKGNKDWKEINIDNESYTDIGKYKKVVFKVPEATKNIRIDFGSSSKNVEFKNVKIYKVGKVEISEDEFVNLVTEKSNVEIVEKDNYLNAQCKSNDPFIVIDDFSNISEQVKGTPVYIKIIITLLALSLGTLTTYSAKNIKKTIKFLREAISNRRLIVKLAKNDFKQKYVSSYLGVIWGFIQPLITIAVYWFVFQVGFRSTDVGNLPFILWFMSGIIPWFFFSEALSSCTNVFMEYSYLVKKVLFKIETLPIIKIISTLFVHCFFIIFLMVVSAFYGFYPDPYMAQLIYYLFAMIVLVFVITIFTSSVVLFFRDLGQIVNIIINVGFWATPIGWNITMLPEFLQKIFKLNPIFYIVTGYRDSLVEKIFFWERPYHTLYFWCFCTVMLLLSVKVFNKLRPHFSDVI